jgi:hypothetical protein
VSLLWRSAALDEVEFEQEIRAGLAKREERRRRKREAARRRREQGRARFKPAPASGERRKRWGIRDPYGRAERA